MTVYAGLGTPKDGVVIPVGTNIVAYHTYASDGVDNPAGDDYQASFQERYRIVGAGSWTTRTVVVGSDTFDTYGTGLAVGSYERQVQTRSNNTGAYSAWSASAFFTVANVPATPTFTAPAVGATVAATTVGSSWTTSGTQRAYEFEVRTATGGAGIVDWTSGVVTSTAQTITVQLPGTGGARYLRVRYLDNTSGAWSGWAERQIVVSWVPPATPTLVATPTDPGTLGMLHALSVLATHPTPSGGQPTVATMDVYVRPLGDTSNGVLVLAGQTPTGAKEWTAPTARRYQARVRAVAADGRFAYSAWTTATTDNTVKGVLLHDPVDPTGTRRAYRLNDTEARDSWEVDSALMEYAGRALPVVEYGDGETRTIEVPVIHSQGISAGDAAALVTLLRRRAIVCYRDRRGRKAYGRLEVGQLQDTFYGSTTGITVTAVDYPADTETA